jgi:hypothetical protein
MGFQFDFTADFFTLDNLQPLTLLITGQADQAIGKALAEPADWKDPDRAGGNVLEGDQQWIWPIAFSPAKPTLGSQLIDAWGTAWTILEVVRKDAVNVWEAHCRNLSVAYGLDNVATVLEASYTKSPGGEAIATWSTVLSGIAARFQPVDQTARILEDAEWPNLSRFPGHGHFLSRDSRRAGLGRLPPGRFGRPALPHHEVPAARADRRPAAGRVRADH